MKRNVTVSALLATASLLAFEGTALGQDAPAPQDAPAVEAPQIDREVIVVRGVNIPDEKRDTSEISSLVDSSDFSVTGDSDAAAALLRVTGLTLSRGRFVNVRGLNERYSSATLNGSPLPSPEPLRRVAPLDLFPTNVLESVLVQKTYSPEYSLEFGGGIIDLRTLALPDEGFLDVGASVGLNSVVQGSDVLLYDGGAEDWTGFDDGTRNLPSGLDATFVNGGYPTDVATRQANAAALTNPSLWVLLTGPASPNNGYELAFGDIYDFGSNVSFGVTGALGYDNSWSVRTGEKSDPIGADGGTQSTRERATNEIETNALLSLGLDLFDDHELKLTALGVRSTEKAAERRLFISSPSFDGALRDTTEWYERQAWMTQAAGEHYFPDLGELELSWRASYSEALRDAPFSTEATYRNFSNDPTDTIVSQDDVRVEFQTLADDTRDIGVDLEYPVLVGPLDMILKAGWTYRENNRETVERTYFFTGNPALAAGQRVDLLIGNAGFQVAPLANASFVPEAYEGHIESDGYYIQGDFQVGPYVRAAIGGRYEDAIQTSNAFTRDGGDDGVIEQAISSQYFLPSATITWNPFDDQQVRFGYSQTIIRPQFRETAPQVFFNSLTDLLSQGNTRLTNTEVTNYDLRYEFYFSRNQFVTAGLFYKELTDPIVEIDGTVGDDLLTKFVNAPAATVQGAEVEFEKAFDLSTAVDWAWLATKDIILNTNYTYIQSEVDNDGTIQRFEGIDSPAFDNGFSTIPASAVIPDGAELAGMSPHLLNIQFGYDDFEARSTARLLFNFADERVIYYRAEGRQDTIEAPPMSLDFRYSRAFDVMEREVEFAFSARNLLDEQYRTYRATEGGERDVVSYDLGQTFSVSLKGRF